MSQQAAVRRWCQFNTVVLGCKDLRLFDKDVVGTPSLTAVRSAEARLMLFAQWLRQDLAPDSVRQYLSSLRTCHADWMGGRSLESLGVDFHALRCLVSIMRKKQPAKKRVKEGFSPAQLQAIIPFSWFARCSTEQRFNRVQGATVATLALEQLLRLNEVVRVGAVPSAANLNQMMVSDLEFFDDEGRVVAFPSGL